MTALSQTEFLVRFQQTVASFPQKKEHMLQHFSEARTQAAQLCRQQGEWAAANLATVAHAIVTEAENWESTRLHISNWPERFTPYHQKQALEELMQKLDMEYYIQQDPQQKDAPYIEWPQWSLPLGKPSAPPPQLLGPVPLDKAFNAYFRSICARAQYVWDTAIPEGETSPRWQLRQQRLKILAEANLAEAQQKLLTYYDRQIVLTEAEHIHLSLPAENMLPASLPAYEYEAYCQQLAELLGPAFIGEEEMIFPMRQPDYIIRPVSV